MAFLPVWWALLCCAWVLRLCWHITGIIREGVERAWVGVSDSPGPGCPRGHVITGMIPGKVVQSSGVQETWV